MKRVLVVFPTAWDEKQLAACRSDWEDRYEVELAGPRDADCRWDFDILSFIDETIERARGRVDGVFSSSDYPGPIAAAAIGSALGLPSSTPQAMLRASHKYLARIAGVRAVPKAMPAFSLVRPGHEMPASLDYPVFVKPVKGTFSMVSGVVSSARELASFVTSEAAEEWSTYYVHMFRRLLGRYDEGEVDGSEFLVEEILCGSQVTVEGYLTRGRARIFGVVDSELDGKTRSFLRFRAPSTLDPAIARRLMDVAARFAEALGLDATFFNVELFYDAEADRVSIIELNPRLCGQFADLHEKTLGAHTYPMALALACGDAFSPPGATPRGVAASYPLRVFRSARVRSAPTPETIGDVERDVPGALVWNECSAGDVLEVGPGIEDGHSRRYAVINLGAASDDALETKKQAVESALAFEMEPAASSSPAREEPKAAEGDSA